MGGCLRVPSALGGQNTKSIAMKHKQAKLLALTLVLSLFGFLALVEGQGGAVARYQAHPLAILPDATHMGVDVDRMYVFETSQVSPQNSGSSFYVDGYWQSPLTVPVGYSFVVTDVLVRPLLGGTPGGEVVHGRIDINGYFRFPIQQLGSDVHSYSLTTGFVLRAGDTPWVNAYSSATNTFFVTIMGYYIEGDARVPGVPFQ